ncbi:MAG TPA: nitrilase-related carbon-nitrogen hydrolase, partial [Bacteroidota bacterium]|nr:nitrilase-related carbon-nitrogen hydrolase [Bacteroidota bacterium]
MNCTVAIAQIDARVGDLERNLATHLRYIDRAIRKKARLIVFPELSLTGYSLRDLAGDVSTDPRTDRFLDPLKKKSREISIAFGLVENAVNHGVYNSAVFLEDGRVKHVHRKVYPPTYGMFEEGRYFSQGDTVAAFDSKLGRFGILICEDAWHASLPYLLALDGAESILCLTASPTRISGNKATLATAEINHEHHRSYARLFNVYMVFSNRVGIEDGVNFWGGSAVFDPHGTPIAQAKLLDEDLIFTELDSKQV